MGPADLPLPQGDAAARAWRTGSPAVSIPRRPAGKPAALAVRPIQREDSRRADLEVLRQVRRPGCYGATKVNTLWDKEVLLMRGTFKVPPLKDGHRYRLRVDDGVHVGNGNGYGI